MVVVLLVSWLSMLISATCTMPMPKAFVLKTAAVMDTCIHDSATKPAIQDTQDCSLKLCLDSTNDTVTDATRLIHPELPVFLLTLAWTFLSLFIFYAPVPIPRKADPPLGRRVLLIYQFCKLLN
jgi:hypothetical protein